MRGKEREEQAIQKVRDSLPVNLMELDEALEYLGESLVQSSPSWGPKPCPDGWCRALSEDADVAHRLLVRIRAHGLAPNFKHPKEGE